MFSFDREVEKVEAFYSAKLEEIKQRIQLIHRNIGKQDCLSPELQQLSEAILRNVNLRAKLGESHVVRNDGGASSAFHDESDSFLLDQIEECRVWVMKLTQYASLNAEGFRKALKKFDKNHPKQSPILAAQYHTKVLSRSFAKYQSTLSSAEGFLSKSSTIIGRQLVSSQAPAGTAEDKPIKEVRRVWEDIYKLQVRSVLESDDISAFKSIIPSMQLKLSLSSLEAGITRTPSGLDSLVAREHTLLIKYLLDSICTHQSVKCLGYVIESEGLPIGHIEGLLNISLIDKVLSSIPERSPMVNENNSSEMIEMLMENGSNLEWRDFRGRNLIHKAVLSGSAICFAKILERLKHRKDLLEQSDHDGLFPLFLAIERNLSQICGTLVRTLSTAGCEILLLSKPNKVLHPIIFASKLGFSETLSVLLAEHPNIDVVDSDGETAVYHCAKRNAVQCLELLLAKGANPNIPENYRNWTPIFAGATEGFESCCALLIKFGADLSHRDRDGWMASEHAVFRGHLELLPMLRPSGKQGEVPGQSSLESTPASTPVAGMEMVKEYGHAYLESTTQLRITLGHGSGDRANHPPVELLTSPAIADNFLQLQISTAGTDTDDARLFDLPLRDYSESISFTISSSDKFSISPWAELRFDLFHHVGGDMPELIGRGSMILQSLIDGDGHPKNNGSVQLVSAILGHGSMDIVALVSFQALVATPFRHSNQNPGKITPYYKSVRTKIIGHRGLGANSGLPHPQIGENTVLSFVMAASLGAEYVEFGTTAAAIKPTFVDVQLTKDKVPVLYHDFIVKETYLETPICSLSLQKFLALRKSHQDKKTRYSTFDDSFLRPAPRGTVLEDDERLRIPGRMPGMIETPFATLREAFRKVPKNIGFNVEVKYPTKDEFLKWGLQYSHEINEYCDKILEVIFDEATDRPLILSSFHPEARTLSHSFFHPWLVV